jgi:hypothetical protein
MAIGDVVLVQLGDGVTSPLVTIKITEQAGGNFSFDVTQSGAVVGDLRGIFFDVGGGKDTLLGAAGNQTGISGLTATGAGTAGLTSNIVDGNDSVTKTASSDTNMNGALAFDSSGAEAKGYDVGMEFGSQGIGSNDVRSVSFTFTNTVGLTLNDFVGMDFGVRMTSVGVEGGARDGSVKLTGESFVPVTDGDESIGCVFEGTQASGDVIVDSQSDGPGTGITVTQVLTGFTIDLNNDGDTLDTNEAHTFSGSPINVDLGNGSSLTMDDDGTYTVNSGDTGNVLFNGNHVPFTVTYDVHQTYTDDSLHKVIGQLDETSTLQFDICGIGSPEGPPPPPELGDKIAKSQGFWSTHDGAPNANEADVALNTSFETFFGVNSNWDTTAPYDVTPPIAGLADITFQQAIDLGGGGQNLLAREAVTAVLNLQENDLAGVSASFQEWYIYERANFASADLDAADDLTGFTAAQILADLQQQVQDAMAGAADAYTVSELNTLLLLTHE